MDSKEGLRWWHWEYGLILRVVQPNKVEIKYQAVLTQNNDGWSYFFEGVSFSLSPIYFHHVIKLLFQQLTYQILHAKNINHYFFHSQFVVPLTSSVRYLHLCFLFIYFLFSFFCIFKTWEKFILYQDWRLLMARKLHESTVLIFFMELDFK